jgi:hypothetical protein
MTDPNGATPNNELIREKGAALQPQPVSLATGWLSRHHW